MQKLTKKQPHHNVQRNLQTDDYKQGRGAQFNTPNRFLKTHYTKAEDHAIDEYEEANSKTQYIEVYPGTIVNKVDSEDVRMQYSMNPYAGCEHGCIYCFARNVHEFWGYSAGLDFEQKILVKKNAPALLRKFLDHKNWNATPIMLSGNTDCYQPAEQKYHLTRQLLQVCNSYNQPVSILTKNAGVLKDAALLAEMAQKKLVSVMVSVTSFNEELRRTMEPRTTTASQRLKVIETLAAKGVRTGIMLGPMIPGLNEHEMQRMLKAGADAGATFTAYTFIRLNGSIQFLFHDWLYKNFPDRADKVWNMIQDAHGGKVNDSRFGLRMRGQGPIADLVNQQYKKYIKMYGLDADNWQPDSSNFRRPGGQIKLF